MSGGSSDPFIVSFVLAIAFIANKGYNRREKREGSIHEDQGKGTKK